MTPAIQRCLPGSLRISALQKAHIISLDFILLHVNYLSFSGKWTPNPISKNLFALHKTNYVLMTLIDNKVTLQLKELKGALWTGQSLHLANFLAFRICGPLIDWQPLGSAAALAYHRGTFRITVEEVRDSDLVSFSPSPNSPKLQREKHFNGPFALLLSKLESKL